MDQIPTGFKVFSGYVKPLYFALFSMNIGFLFAHKDFLAAGIGVVILFFLFRAHVLTDKSRYELEEKMTEYIRALEIRVVELQNDFHAD